MARVQEAKAYRTDLDETEAPVGKPLSHSVTPVVREPLRP
jgi:hypothetical protein